MSEYVPKIRQLKGCKLTPDTVLARTLDKRAHIESVAVVIQWTDGSVDVDWSSMSAATLTFMSAVLRIHVDTILQGKDG